MRSRSVSFRESISFTLTPRRLWLQVPFWAGLGGTVRAAFAERLHKRIPLGIGIAMPLALALGSVSTPAVAQAPSSLAACQPPAANEYLVLIITPSDRQQAQVRRILPSSVNTAFCRYLNDPVTRVGGFSHVEAANAWAKAVHDSTGLATFVARPPQAVPQPAAGFPAVGTAPTPANAFNPRALDEGYAVVVHYFNRPEVATRLQQTLGRNIGLVVYGQRPYLLAIHTTDPAAAAATLRSLNSQGYLASLVDSRNVILLRDTVAP